MVAHLLNIDETLATMVSNKLGLDDLPDPVDAANAPRDLPLSPALSIIENGPQSFEGRKVGVLVSDGADISAIKNLSNALKKEGALLEVIAPKVGGVLASDGTHISAKHMIDGGPSILFDAVALLLTQEGAESLTKEAAARDFVADAFAHCKFIGFSEGAEVLLRKAGVAPDADEGLLRIGNAKSVGAFIESCRQIRLWAREPAVSCPSEG
jgi:catalase